MDAAPPTPLTISPDQPVPAEFDLLCEGCGYSLVGLMVDRCPECGQPFDARELPLARVPWLYRKRLGRAGAYAQTLRLALFQPRAMAAELCRPVRISEQDAHRFRMLTIFIGSGGVAASVAGLLERVEGFWPPRVETLGMAAGWLGVWVGTFVVLRMATDLPTFIWQGMPGRTDDLSPLHQYAAAPLALLVPAAVVYVAVLHALTLGMPRGDELVAIGVTLLLAAASFVLLWAWFVALVFMRTATRCSLGRVALLGAYLPVHWALMAALVLMTVSAFAYYGAELLF